MVFKLEKIYHSSFENDEGNVKFENHCFVVCNFVHNSNIYRNCIKIINYADILRIRIVELLRKILYPFVSRWSVPAVMEIDRSDIANSVIHRNTIK